MPHWLHHSNCRRPRQPWLADTRHSHSAALEQHAGFTQLVRRWPQLPSSVHEKMDHAGPTDACCPPCKHVGRKMHPGMHAPNADQQCKQTGQDEDGPAPPCIPSQRNRGCSKCRCCHGMTTWEAVVQLHFAHSVERRPHPLNPRFKQGADQQTAPQRDEGKHGILESALRQKRDHDQRIDRQHAIAVTGPRQPPADLDDGRVGYLMHRVQQRQIEGERADSLLPPQQTDEQQQRGRSDRFPRSRRTRLPPVLFQRAEAAPYVRST